MLIAQNMSLKFIYPDALVTCAKLPNGKGQKLAWLARAGLQRFCGTQSIPSLQGPAVAALSREELQGCQRPWEALTADKP